MGIFKDIKTIKNCVDTINSSIAILLNSANLSADKQEKIKKLIIERYDDVIKHYDNVILTMHNVKNDIATLTNMVSDMATKNDCMSKNIDEINKMCLSVTTDMANMQGFINEGFETIRQQMLSDINGTIESFKNEIIDAIVNNRKKK